LNTLDGGIDLKKIIVAAIIFVAFIGMSMAQSFSSFVPNTGLTSTGAPPWLGGAVLGTQQFNSTFSYEQSVQGNGYFMNYMYAKQSNLAFKNYAHGSGQIDNEMTLNTYHQNRSIWDYGNYWTAYGSYTDYDEACIQFKEDNSMVYAPMQIAVGTGYYRARPLLYDSLLKEKTWGKNYRAGTSMHHEVEYAHALDKELELTLKEKRNFTYDPYWEGVGVTQMKLIEDVTDGKAHIGVLQANEALVPALSTDWNNLNEQTFGAAINGGKPGTAWHDPAIEIDEDYWGTYHIEKNMTLEVPYIRITKSDNWLPCCFGGWNTLPQSYQAAIGKDTKGIFDCTCYKAPIVAEFPRVY
jgi:hypothetical protein